MSHASSPRTVPCRVGRCIAAGARPGGRSGISVRARLQALLDATGLNGTRSPFGACQNAFNPAFVSGGSSSGTGVVPVCRSVDTVSIFALTSAVLAVAAAYDEADAFSRKAEPFGVVFSAGPFRAEPSLQLRSAVPWDSWPGARMAALRWVGKPWACERLKKRGKRVKVRIGDVARLLNEHAGVRLCVENDVDGGGLTD